MYTGQEPEPEPEIPKVSDGDTERLRRDRTVNSTTGWALEGTLQRFLRLHVFLAEVLFRETRSTETSRKTLFLGPDRGTESLWS